MSLFENSLYQWRETYFVLFPQDCRPSVTAVQKALRSLDPRYLIEDVRDPESGIFESCTVISPHDFAAMDITCSEGPDVPEHIQELIPTLTEIADTADEKEKIASLVKFNARLDIYHFEQMAIEPDAGEEDEHLDPGSLLIVLERLAKLCEGVAVDPQSGAVI